MTLTEKLLAWSMPVTETGCWIWLGSHKTAGYGRIRIKNERHLAHRVSYEVFKGSIPDGLTIDHLCRVRCCINPDHLEPVTFKENIRRGFGPSGINSRKEFCKNNHPFNESNTYFDPSGGRDCRACANLRYENNKEVVLERRADYYKRNSERIKARVRAYRERKQLGTHN